MRPLFAHLSKQQAHTYRLVLSAAGIPCNERTGPGGRTLLVPGAHCKGAVRAVSLYLKENQENQQQPAVAAFRPSDAFRHMYSSLYMALGLVSIHWAVRPGPEEELFIRTFAADARLILDGQLYRCFTALLLHKDAGHLAANVAGLFLFGTIVASTCGWGVGWLLIVLAGACGNLFNALFYQHAHVSIGASTAVFAAVGVIAVQAFFSRLRQAREVRRQLWLPVGGALAFLAFTGAAPETDLLAHLFGLGAGLLLGGFYAGFVRHPPMWAVQSAAAAGAVLLLVASWAWGVSQ